MRGRRRGAPCLPGRGALRARDPGGRPSSRPRRDAEEAAALDVALEAGALQPVERDVERLADERRDRPALGWAGDGQRALLVDGLGAAEDGDEQHAGEEAAGTGERHAQAVRSAVRACLHARGLVSRTLAHALARSASKRCSSGSPFSGEGHLDEIEVARDLGALERRARLVADLAAGVARREMREHEQADLGLERQLGRLAGRRVTGLQRALVLLVGEGRLVRRGRRPRGRPRAPSRTARCRPTGRSCAPRARGRRPARGSRR